MYVFLVLAAPLGFALLVLAVYPGEERAATKRAFFRGLVASVPMLVAARLLGSILPRATGTIWSVFHEWADRILPYSFLPAALYAVFYRYGERLPAGAARRRLTSFYAGALAPVGIVEAFRVWGTPDSYKVIILPLLLGAMVLVMPRLAFELRDGYGRELALLVGASALGSLVAALVPFLLLRRFWPLAWLAPAAALWYAWRFSLPELALRPPPPEE